jgi:hypothetical protein
MMRIRIHNTGYNFIQMYLSSPPTQSERPDLLEASARAKPPPNRNMMPHGNLNTGIGYHRVESSNIDRA